MNQEVKIKLNGAQIFAALVYVGVVVASTTLFISMVLSAFPADAYLSRAIMTLAGLLIGASGVAFPVALHMWTFEKTHRGWTIAFYYGEIAIMAANIVVSFMTLLAKNSGYDAPQWAVLYEPFSVGAIIYTMLAWGTIFLLDPQHKAIQQSRDLKDEFEKEVGSLRKEYLKTVEGRQSIATAANEDIRELLLKQRNGPVHWGVAPGSIPAPAPFVKKEASTSSPLGQEGGEQS